MYLKWTAQSILLIVACLGFQASANAQFIPLTDQGKVSSIHADITVDHGDYIAGGDGTAYCPSTGSYANERNLTAMAATAIVSKLGLGVWGALAVNFLETLFDEQIRQSGGTIKEWLEGFGAVDSFAACGNVTLAVPAGKVIRQVKLYATDDENGGEMLPCQPPDANGRYICHIGWSEWVIGSDGRVYTGLFKNWSGDRTRQASMVIDYYEGRPQQ
jgi:hypothetical protein